MNVVYIAKKFESMKTIGFLIIVLFISFETLSAMGYSSEKDTIVVLKPEPVDFNFESNLDSLLNLWYVRQSVDLYTTRRVIAPSEIYPDFSDSVYMDRLARIPSVFDLSYNRIFKNYIDVYTKKKRDQMEIMLGLTDYYFPIFEEILDQNNMPLELKYLAVVESALNPRAVSRAGATGIWQFMYGTAKMYGLTMNSFVDERRDPIRATHAAALYLKDLHRIYNDWTLAIAAYNCGPGNVNKAIRRAGGKRNYWDIYYFLPRETRGYVPAYIAATYAMNFYDEHNLSPRAISMPVFTDTIMVNRQLHLAQVSEVLGVELQLLRDINPHYRRDIIPGNSQNFSIALPMEFVGPFIDFEDSIYAYKSNEFFNRDLMTVAPSRATFTADTPAGQERLTYTVKSGDNLGQISEWYRVRVTDLRYWNNITGNLIRVNQRLVVYVPRNRADVFREINSMSFSEKQAFVARGYTLSAVQATGAKTATESYTGDFIYYRVKQGDTLWDIARRFPGVSETDILRLNNLSNANRIFPGQQLRIMPKES